jgi:hypothetical protein
VAYNALSEGNVRIARKAVRTDPAVTTEFFLLEIPLVSRSSRRKKSFLLGGANSELVAS